MTDTPAKTAFEFWIDRGGTFTDVIGRRPDGTLTALKLLSNSDAYEDAATEGVRRVLGLAHGAAIPEGALAEARRRAAGAERAAPVHAHRRRTTPARPAGRSDPGRG